MLSNSKMTTIDKDKPLIPFLFMGCWNEDDSPRVSVAKAIMENPIETLVLGGDNIYPQKLRIGNATDFTKVYSQKTLMNGVHMLNGKDIYAALGNHNVGGPMLKTQLGLTEWTMPSRYYSVNFSDYTLIIIDSNLVEDVDKYNIMREWLEGKLTELEELDKKYYYVQHDPFISFKKKKKTAFPKLSELLGILSKYPPIAILCADTHNFQKGTLQIGDITIPQYIVGTGGAHPDFVNASVGETHTVDGVIYRMDEYIPGYGYLEVTPEETKFIKVADWRSFEAKGGKRIRKTHKKLKRRNRKSRKYIK
jgi:hypothetical protein